jgi:hypothetical protein
VCFASIPRLQKERPDAPARPAKQAKSYIASPAVIPAKAAISWRVQYVIA